MAPWYVWLIVGIFVAIVVGCCCNLWKHDPCWDRRREDSGNERGHSHSHQPQPQPQPSVVQTPAQPSDVRIELPALTYSDEMKAYYDGLEQWGRANGIAIPSRDRYNFHVSVEKKTEDGMTVSEVKFYKLSDVIRRSVSALPLKSQPFYLKAFPQVR